MADFVCNSTMTTLAAGEQTILRQHAADAAVALIAGARSPEGRELIALRPRAGGADKAAIAAAIIRSTEVDDIHIQSCVTPTSVAMPAALLAGEGDLAQAEDAIRIAIEFSVRMGLAIDGPNTLYRGIWPTCFVTPLAVAAAQCRMRGMDAPRTAHALSMALMMSSGRIGRFQGQPTGRWIILNAAFVNGVAAVEAAAQGFKGDTTLLDGPWLQNAMGIAPDLNLLVENLDRACAFAGLGLKPFSTARQALSPTQALMDLISEGLKVETIEAIEVRVPEAYVAMISRPIEPFRPSGYTNAGFQMALAALKQAHLWDLDRSSVMTDPALLAFAGKVSVKADSALLADYPRRWRAEVEVKAGGRTWTRQIESPRGDAANRLSENEIRRKGIKLLLAGMDQASADATYQCAANIFESGSATLAIVDRMNTAMTPAISAEATN
jgi:2-methylcitrate dehydratase PrpD